MRLIFHVGAPKTGTTTLQFVLNENRQYLASQGILYPDSPNNNISHCHLAAGLLKSECWSRHLRQHYLDAPERAKSYAESLKHGIAQGVQSIRPHTVILSGETFFQDFSVCANDELLAFLGGITDDITTVAYVREPAASYLSNVAQKVKLSSVFDPPGPVHFRNILSSYGEVLPGKAVILPFERTMLMHQDLVVDFFTRFLPGIPVGRLNIPAPLNTSLSAEGMLLTQTFRRHCFREMDDVKTKESGRLVSIVQSVEKRMRDLTRPRLHDSVRNAINNGSTDLLWLRDAHGIQFPGVDYAKIGLDVPAAFNSDMGLGDIIQINREKYDELKSLVILQLMHQGAA